MSIWDIALMAVHNLWSQKMRTTLNLLGVVISSALLLMTFAATRGASDGIMNMINSSSQTRQFLVIAARNPNATVPESATKIEGDLDPKKRKRLEEALRRKWISANASRVFLTVDVLKQLRSIEGVSAIVPRKPLTCKLSLGDRSTDGSLIGISLNDQSLKRRLACGEIPAKDDHDGVLLDEYTAYTLGLRALGPAASQLDLTTLSKFSSSVKQLAEKMDEVGLSQEEKDAVQLGLKQLSIVAPTNPDAKSGSAADAGDSKSKQNSRERELVIRGVVKRPSADEGAGFLQFTGAPRLASVYIDSRAKEPLNFQLNGFPGFFTAACAVARTDQLAPVVQEMESVGLTVRSAVGIVEKLKEETGKARLAISALALLILLVAALGISNTMIIAIMERTPEFGIMKSLGASDGQIMWLVLLEGLITGLLGAALALAISVAAVPMASELCRHYIEARLETSFNQSIFSFVPADVLVVFLLAGTVCTVASLLPAWRAAKLDPVVAMRR